MAQIELHPDFKDFLRLLNLHSIEYLVIGGYAVGYYGYPRATGDMDIWIAVSEVNARKMAQLRTWDAEREAIKDGYRKDKISETTPHPISKTIL